MSSRSLYIRSGKDKNLLLEISNAEYITKHKHYVDREKTTYKNK